MLPPRTPLFRNHFTSALRNHASSSSSNPPHLSLLADKCTSMHQLKQIHAQMVVSARIHDNYAVSRLLSFCALSESGDLGYALKLFQFTQEPNSFMWNTLIRAHASSPNSMHSHVLKFGLDLDLHVVNGLVRSYSVSGDLTGARRVFDETPERNLSIWTTMICGYAQNFCANEALELFDQMTAPCAQSGFLDLGKRIHAFLDEKGVEAGIIIGTALVHMYAKNGAISMARKCFESMAEKNIATWNAMICGLAVHGHAEEALGLFQKLERDQVIPNDVTLVGVLSACCHAGLIGFGRKIFFSMKDVYGILPKIEHYGCMVDLLGRRGRLLEAEELIRGMPWKADVVIWGALLGACKNQGNIEVAERVVKEILELEPHNHGVYIVLSNMYAEAARWEDVSRLRKVMKKGQLKKTPGWSLVDGDN
ncbi:hypothetical protein NMG60_11026710 [Bertholletia excelsa]